jgi:hypothetical protein
MNPPAKQYKNRVLAALPKAELNRLKPHLSPVTLKVRSSVNCPTHRSKTHRSNYGWFTKRQSAPEVVYGACSSLVCG